MKFSYKKYGSGVLRPVIPLTIEYQSRSISYEVLVDSGADFCVFDAQIGELLGIDVESGIRQNMSGITGVIQPYYLHMVTLRVGGWPYTAAVGFLPNIANVGYGVVGQKGFFDRFIVKFYYEKEEIELKEKQ